MSLLTVDLPKGVCPRPALVARFETLVAEWKSTRAPSSSVSQLAMHPAYQQIIGLGPDVLPLIFRELTVAPAQWFWALRALTGENPVDEAHRGDIPKMTADWLGWGKQQGYEW
jgi:hypothetical protein